MEFQSKQDKKDVNIVKSICGKHNIACFFDHDRHTSRPTTGQVPFTFYVNTPYGMAYVRKFIDTVIINDPEAIKQIIPWRIFEEKDKLMKEKQAKERLFTEAQEFALKSLGLSKDQIKEIYPKIMEYAKHVGISMDVAISDTVKALGSFSDKELDMIPKVLHRAYSMPLPWWRVLFCTRESAQRLYNKRVKGFKDLYQMPKQMINQNNESN